MQITSKLVGQYRQRQAILAALGVRVWVGKDTPTLRLPKVSSDIVQIDTPNDTLDVPMTNDGAISPKSTPIQILQTPNLQVGDLPSHITQNHTPKQMPNLSKCFDKANFNKFNAGVAVLNLPPDLSAIRLKTAKFSLYGVRFGAWLLLADGSQMDTATLSVWQSLTHALQKQNAHCVVRQARYPLCDSTYAEFSSFEPILPAFLGFFTRLYDKDVAYIGLVTPLVGIDLGQMLLAKQQSVPSLEQMSYNNASKKQLWQQLTQSHLSSFKEQS